MYLLWFSYIGVDIIIKGFNPAENKVNPEIDKSSHSITTLFSHSKVHLIDLIYNRTWIWRRTEDQRKDFIVSHTFIQGF